MDIASRLRAARIEGGLTQTALAKDICAVSYVSHVEAGRREPSARLLNQFEERLALTPGSLQQTTPSLTPSSASTAAMLTQALEHLRNGAYASAEQLAHHCARAAGHAGETGVQWMALKCQYDATLGLSKAEAALPLADEILAVPGVDASPSLNVRSHLCASGAHYLYGNRDAARHHADAAKERAFASLAPGDPLRAKALCAQANVDPERTNTQALQAELDFVADAHTRGACAWVLGNAAFRLGKVSEGLAWHASAQEWLSPMADFRNWARFLRATLTERLEAGTLVGVRELMAQARIAIDMLDVTDESALLAGVEARLMLLENKPRDAVALLEPWVENEGVPDRTRTELVRLLARAQ